MSLETVTCQCFPPVSWATGSTGRCVTTTGGWQILATSPGPGIPSTAAIVFTEARRHVMAAPVHSWDTDMHEPAIDPALARQRLLDAADELFYRQGMHRVSIDRVIEKAGVPAETLREAFGSTDELVRAYLRARHTRLAGRARARTPRLSHTP